MKKILLFSFAFFLLASSSNSINATIIIIPEKSEKAILPGDPDPGMVKAAVKELKSLSGKERRVRIRDAKKELRNFKAEKKAGQEPSTSTLLLVILAILLPPLAVYLHEGEINSRFWISLLLTLIFWLPGVVYALIIILGNQ